MKRFTYILFSLVMVFALMLSACKKTQPVEPVQEGPQTPGEVDTPVEPVGTTRKGGWLDEIVVSVIDGPSVIVQMEANTIDTYVNGFGTNDLDQLAASGLPYTTSNGTYYTIQFNPAEFNEGINVFRNRKIREAFNYLIDRNYINQEFYAGGALPKWFAIMTNFGDYALLADTARRLETKYAYNFDKAKEIIDAEMEAAGYPLTNGKYMNADGEQYEVIFLVRNDGDGTRKAWGTYLAGQMEKLGFAVDFKEGTGGDLGPIWIAGDPKAGEWHIYTGGWGASVLNRDQSNIFQEMYLPTSAQGLPVFMENDSDPEFQELGDKLYNREFTTMEERADMMARALELSLEDSLQVMVVDSKRFVPHQEGLVVTTDLAAGVESAQITPFTLRWADKEGGTVRWATQPFLFNGPWNPVRGSNTTSDQGAVRMTVGYATTYDPYTGLLNAFWVDKAEVTVLEGLPVQKTLDWLTLDFVDEIEVPGDAWADWDAETQTFITVDEKIVLDVAKAEEALKAAEESIPPLEEALAEAQAALEELGEDAEEEAVAEAEAAVEEAQAALTTAQDSIPGLTQALADKKAVTKVTSTAKAVVYFREDLFDVVKWHDGSNLEMADIMISYIMGFDRAKQESAIFDKQPVGAFNVFMSTFKGFKIISTDPLIMEGYQDTFSADAELLVPIGYTWINNFQGEGSFASYAMMNSAEAAHELAYTESKALELEVEQTSTIGGPSLEILTKHLDKLIADGTIPYEPTLGQYITKEQAIARYKALKAHFEKYGNYHQGVGPYFLKSVDLNGKSLVMAHWDQYPDLADRWSMYSAPKIADVDIEGPAEVKGGEEAEFDIFVSFEGKPYELADIKEVKFLVYDAANNVVIISVAEPVEDGHFKIKFTGDDTKKFGNGATKIEVAVISIAVAQPTFQTIEFITAQ